MATFMTRVELHSATYQDYVNLHTYMTQQGFTNSILSGDGILYKLPPAEYNLTANCTAVQARDKAAGAAARTFKSYAILTAEYDTAAWVGLEKASELSHRT
jgi:hypothetical protein